MTDFTTRIELHDATAQDYATLDVGMEAMNFSRVVRSGRGVRYRMPSATYFSQSNLSASEVRNLAVTAASATGRRYDIVTTSGEVAYFLHPSA